MSICMKENESIMWHDNLEKNQINFYFSYSNTCILCRVNVMGFLSKYLKRLLRDLVRCHVVKLKRHAFVVMLVVLLLDNNEC